LSVQVLCAHARISSSAEKTEFDVFRTAAVNYQTKSIAPWKPASIVRNDELTSIHPRDELRSARRSPSVPAHKSGATYRQIAAALSMTDQSALREIKSVLCSLASKVLDATDRASV